MCLELDTEIWAEQQFGACELGDRRRTRCLVEFAAQVAGDPDASTPTQVERWSDLKRAYRLISRKEATFDAISACHWEQTRKRESGTWLISCDTTEIDFGVNNKASGLAAVGGKFGNGFLLHSGLMIHPETSEVIGLAGQKVRYRQTPPTGESRSGRLARDRESLMWPDLVEQIGRPQDGVKFIDICDRAADNFELYSCQLINRHDWIVRAQHVHRKIIGNNRETTLAEFVKSLPNAGSYVLNYRTAQGTRRAKLQVRLGSFLMPAPVHKSPRLKEWGITAIAMNVVVVHEIGAKRGVEPLRWILLTSLPVANFEQAWTVIEHYEKRPIVEEFHKALKTGCQVQARKYETHDRLEAITALLSIVATRLLQIRSAARDSPASPASKHVPNGWISMLEKLRRGTKIHTVRDFYRQLAGLGGHLLRKGDGEPGWLTLWRGFEKLHIAMRATKDS